MIWTSALWFVFAVFVSSKSANENFMDIWPYVWNDHKDIKYQSPVDINTTDAYKLPLPKLNYDGYWAIEKSEIVITNTGHTSIRICIKLSNTSDYVPSISGGPLFNCIYVFEQMHFHWGENDCGSEHDLDGYTFALEIHIVHYKKEYGSFKNAQKYCDGICVIGYFGELSAKDNHEMDHFIEDLKLIVDKGSQIIRHFSEEFSWIKETALKDHYYTYPGSLTTEPFGECVIWIIFTEPFEVSSRELKVFRELHSIEAGELLIDNDRTLQLFNERPIVYVV